MNSHSSDEAFLAGNFFTGLNISSSTHSTLGLGAAFDLKEFVIFSGWAIDSSGNISEVVPSVNWLEFEFCISEKPVELALCPSKETAVSEDLLSQSSSSMTSLSDRLGKMS